MRDKRRLYEMHAEMCRVFTSAKRLEILDLLRNGEKSVSELVALSKLPQANLSQHLTVLRQKRVVNTRRAGTAVYYSISNIKILKAFDIIRSMLKEQFAEENRLLKSL